MDTAGPEDIVIIQRVLAGDADAFRVIVRRYGGRLRGFCLARLGDADEADDALQDVLLRAYRSLGGFRLGSSFASWLFAIAANRVRRGAGAPPRTGSLCGARLTSLAWHTPRPPGTGGVCH